MRTRTEARLVAAAEIMDQLADELREGLDRQRQDVDAVAARLLALSAKLDQLPVVLERAREIVETAAKGELVTASEMAERIRVAPGTLRMWARDGRVPAYRLGDGERADWRFDVAEVLRAVKAAEASGAYMGAAV